MSPDIHTAIFSSEKATTELRLFRKLVNNSNDMFFIIDPDTGKILDVNSTGCKMLGYSRGELYQMKITDISSHLCNSSICQNYLLALRILRNYSGETVYRCKDGNSLPVEENIRYVNIENSDYIIAAVRDIIKRKKNEKELTDIIRELKNSKQKLEEKQRDLSTLFYRNSHDLKSPLATLLGINQLAKKQITDEKAKKYLELINICTLQLEHLLNNLLRISVLSNGKLVPEKIFLKQFVNEIIKELCSKNHVFSMVGFNVRCTVHSEIYCDKNLLHTVFYNLIENAAFYKYSPAKKHKVTISISEENGCIKIGIKDNGIGMNAETQKKIFEMFFKGNENSKGNGLGLYLVRNTMEKLGGSVSIKSKPGKGTESNVLFPKEFNAAIN